MGTESNSRPAPVVDRADKKLEPADRPRRMPNDNRRFVIGLGAALACWAMMRAVMAEQTDSGWIVARPSTLAAETERADPAARIAIDHVLGQSRVPLLSSPAPGQTSSVGGEPRPVSPRLAQQLPGVDGWRSSAVPTSPESAATNRDGQYWPEQSPITEESGITKSGPAAAAPVAEAPQDAASEEPRGNDPPLFRAPRIDSLPAIEFGHTHREPEPSGVEPEVSASEAPELGCHACEEGDAPRDIDLPSADEANDAEGDATDAFDFTITDDVTVDGGADQPAQIRSDSGGDAEAEPIIEEDIIEEETTESATAPNTLPTQTRPGQRATQPATIDPRPEPKPLVPLTRQLMNLRGKVRNVLKGYYRKSLNSRDNDPWEVMHGMLSYELHSRLHQSGPRGNLITSIGWLCYNKPCKGLTLLYATPDGELRAKQGVGLQGHKGQLLAMLAQCRVSPEYPIRVGSQQFTIHDLIEAEKKTCYPKTELTFKLIALAHYLDLNDTWVNDEGLDWSIPRLIREELAQPVRGAACGGTHRLSGLSLAVKARERRGGALDGEYLRAAEYVEKYEQYAFRLQNRDGSLSTRWFQGSGDEDDIDRRVKTTGHILEWLVYSLSDEELRDQRTIRAVNYLATLLYENYDHDWEIGPRSHAIHALLKYDERVFKPLDGAQEVAGAKKQQPTARRMPNRSNRR